MRASHRAAHRYATKKAAAYAAKFSRPVKCQAVDSVYVAAYASFLRRAAA